MTAAPIARVCACGKPARVDRTTCAACESRERRERRRAGCRICGAPALKRRTLCGVHHAAKAAQPRLRATPPPAPCATEGCPNERKGDKRYCGPCTYRRKKGTSTACAPYTLQPFICKCGLDLAEHPKCSACGLLAGDPARHEITVDDLRPWGDETGLCWMCRRARELRRAA